jgi:hypothetical protein
MLWKQRLALLERSVFESRGASVHGHASMSAMGGASVPGRWRRRWPCRRIGEALRTTDRCHASQLPSSIYLEPCVCIISCPWNSHMHLSRNLLWRHLFCPMSLVQRCHTCWEVICHAKPEKWKTKWSNSETNKKTDQKFSKGRLAVDPQNTLHDGRPNQPEVAPPYCQCHIKNGWPTAFRDQRSYSTRNHPHIPSLIDPKVAAHCRAHQRWPQHPSSDSAATGLRGGPTYYSDNLLSSERRHRYRYDYSNGWRSHTRAQ